MEIAMFQDEQLQTIVQHLSELAEVEAIVLAGSSATHTSDNHSDYDVYVYSSAPLELTQRKQALAGLYSYMEFNNQYWETEDDGVLLNGKEIELIYRSFDWLENRLKHTVIEYQAETGYSTCFWANVIHSEVLFDRHQQFRKLQQRYNVEYPVQLQRNIINKNRDLLRGKMPSYFGQIKKALLRDDLISVNHRIAAFLASYFDIIFALNKIKHPGEKKILAILNQQAPLLPQEMEQQINQILSFPASGSGALLTALNQLIETLDRLLIQTGFNIRELTSDDAVVHQLLQASGLNSSDLQQPNLSLWGYFTGEQLTGIIGLERYGHIGLLRSLAVQPSERQQGIGQKLVAYLEQQARDSGIHQLYLLTQTADTFFIQQGYQLVARKETPDVIQQTSQFSALCPASSRLLSKWLNGSMRDD
jgi:N-acetylglutamate synthase and related acetyltransferases